MSPMATDNTHGHATGDLAFQECLTLFQKVFPEKVQYMAVSTMQLLQWNDRYFELD